MRQILAHESALGAGGDDDGVLDDLRLHQAENFGTEVFAAIRPAQPAASNPAVAQVHTLNLGRVDKNLEPGPRQRRIRDLRGICRFLGLDQTTPVSAKAEIVLLREFIPHGDAATAFLYLRYGGREIEP